MQVGFYSGLKLKLSYPILFMLGQFKMASNSRRVIEKARVGDTLPVIVPAHHQTETLITLQNGCVSREQPNVADYP